MHIDERLKKKKYPILEFDATRKAVIEPGEVVKPENVPTRCVICFFSDVIAKLYKKGITKKIGVLNSEMGPNPIYELKTAGKGLALVHLGIGSPLVAGFLEEMIARGCSKFIVCGGAGVLDKKITVGHIVIPVAAIRDEGTSYHYMPPGREVYASPKGVKAIKNVLKKRGIPYIEGKTWTTDGIYRETPGKVKLRKSEGCLTVEMEAAAFFAVANFRNVTLAQMLYSGDDVSGKEWDPRNGHKRDSVRMKLFWLAAEACLSL
ncbi:MAG: nucleoside phosphorylase [Euryarchaeota archaeon]|nr:nucleoside phosphorylase [Euryarchaeota archaeon]